MMGGEKLEVRSKKLEVERGDELIVVGGVAGFNRLGRV